MVILGGVIAKQRAERLQCFFSVRLFDARVRKVETKHESLLRHGQC
jgi:hypothetical protein